MKKNILINFKTYQDLESVLLLRVWVTNRQLQVFVNKAYYCDKVTDFKNQEFFNLSKFEFISIKLLKNINTTTNINNFK